MTKAELIKEISQETGIQKKVVEETIEVFMKITKRSLIDRQSIHLRGFGSFHLKTKREKKARNIAKNETIVIPEHMIPTFKPCKDFVNTIKAIEVDVF